MSGVFRSIWAVLIWLFLILIPIQFYLAGHGAMEGANAANKKIVPMTTSWDPHSLLGTLLALIAILVLLTSLGAALPRQLRIMTGAFFIAMLVQFFLPFFDDSAGGRVIASFHAVNALIVTGLAIMLAIRARPYLPVAAWRGSSTPEVAPQTR